MKVLVNISRLLVGVLFIFSGFIKSNDSKGFSYKLEEYFDIFAQDLRVSQDSFSVQVKESNEHFVELKEGVYHFDSEKEIVVERKKGISIPIDTLMYHSVDLNLQNRNGELLNIGVMLRDSSEVVPIEILAFMGSQEIYKKKLLVDYENFSDIYDKVDISEYIKEDSVLVNLFEYLKTKALFLSIFICVLEIVLGIAVLLGWKPKLVSWLLLLTILFFTFLTWYSATYDKVTDCGCFGDAIKLKPWESFYKDVILLVLILIVWLGRNKINLLFSKNLTGKIVGMFMVLSTSYALYCTAYLPVIDFLNFAEGKDVVKDGMTYPEGARKEPLMEIYYVYEVNGQEDTFTYNSETGKFTPERPEGAKYVTVAGEQIVEEAYKLPIHDFSNIQNGFEGDVTERMLSEEGYQIWIVCKDLASSDEKAWSKIKDLTKPWVKKGHSLYALTASSLEVAEAHGNEVGLPFHFYNADQTLLKSMIRSNPGIILLKGTKVVKRWSSRSVPSYDAIKKIVE